MANRIPVAYINGSYKAIPPADPVEIPSGCLVDGSACSIQINSVLTTDGGDQNVCGNKTFEGSVLICQNLCVLGSCTIIDSCTLEICDREILVNAGETGAGIDNGTGCAGICMCRGTLTDYHLIFDDSDDTLKTGLIGSEVAISLAGHCHPTSAITDFTSCVEADSCVSTNTTHRNCTNGNPHGTTFLALGDTPETFTANCWVKVASDGCSLEYVNAPAGGVTTFTGLNDTPPAYTGAGCMVVINGTNNGLAFASPPATNYLPLAGGDMSGDIDMCGNDILNIGNSSLTFVDAGKIVSSNFDCLGGFNLADEVDDVTVEWTAFTPELLIDFSDDFELGTCPNDVTSSTWLGNGTEVCCTWYKDSMMGNSLKYTDCQTYGEGNLSITSSGTLSMMTDAIYGRIETTDCMSFNTKVYAGSGGTMGYGSRGTILFYNYCDSMPAGYYPIFNIMFCASSLSNCLWLGEGMMQGTCSTAFSGDGWRDICIEYDKTTGCLELSGDYLLDLVVSSMNQKSVDAVKLEAVDPMADSDFIYYDDFALTGYNPAVPGNLSVKDGGITSDKICMNLEDLCNVTTGVGGTNTVLTFTGSQWSAQCQTFLKLNDTPNSYTGSSGCFLCSNGSSLIWTSAPPSYTGDYSTSFQASGGAAHAEYSAAFGTNASACGSYSFVAGEGAASCLNGTHGVSLGYYAKSHSNCSIAIGNFANSCTLGAVAIGNNACASGQQSTAIGPGAKTFAFQASSFGSGNLACSCESIAMGHQMQVGSTVTDAMYSFGINLGSTAPSPLTQVSTMAIMGGCVGMGCLTPTEALEVLGNVKATCFIGNGNGLTNVASAYDADCLNSQLPAYYTCLNNATGNLNPLCITSFDDCICAGAATVIGNTSIGSLNDVNTSGAACGCYLCYYAAGEDSCWVLTGPPTVTCAADAACLNAQLPSYYLSRTNHTGSQGVSTLSDFTACVDANTCVSANSSHRGLVTGNPHSVTASEVAALPLAGGTMSGSINMGGCDITNIGNTSLAFASGTCICAGTFNASGLLSNMTKIANVDTTGLSQYDTLYWDGSANWCVGGTLDFLGTPSAGDVAQWNGSSWALTQLSTNLTPPVFIASTGTHALQVSACNQGVYVDTSSGDTSNNCAIAAYGPSSGTNNWAMYGTGACGIWGVAQATGGIGVHGYGACAIVATGTDASNYALQTTGGGKGIYSHSCIETFWDVVTCYGVFATWSGGTCYPGITCFLNVVTNVTFNPYSFSTRQIQIINGIIIGIA